MTSHTVETLLALVATRSYVITASTRRREEIMAGVRELAERLGAPFELPYRTVAFRAVRDGSPPPGAAARSSSGDE